MNEFVAQLGLPGDDPSRDTPVNMRLDVDGNWPFDVIGGTPRETATRKAIQAFLLNLVFAHDRDNPNVAVSLSKASYKAGAGGLYTYSKMKASTDFAVEHGLAEKFAPAPGSRGRCSTFCATTLLIKIYRQAPPRYRVGATPVLQMRDSDGLPMQMNNSTRVNTMMRTMDRINEMITSIRFTHQNAVEFHGRQHMTIWHPKKKRDVFTEWFVKQPQMSRIFNGDFQHGGRLYGMGQSVQGVPEVARKGLLLNGEPTVELDFDNLHPWLSYAARSLVLFGDAYTSEQDRTDYKIAYQIALNARTENAAIGAIVQMLRKKYGASVGQRGLAAELLNEIKANHPIVQDTFHTGVGLELQRTDSDMALFVLDRLMKANIPVYPIHDSFIVAEHHSPALVEAMEAVRARKVQNTKGVIIFPARTVCYRKFARHNGAQAIGVAGAVQPELPGLWVAGDNARVDAAVLRRSLGEDKFAHYLNVTGGHTRNMKNGHRDLKNYSIAIGNAASNLSLLSRPA